MPPFYFCCVGFLFFFYWSVKPHLQCQMSNFSAISSQSTYSEILFSNNISMECCSIK